jgi:hypothetical protein
LKRTASERRSRAPGAIAVDWSGAVAGVRRKLWLAQARAGVIARLECGRDRGELVAHLIECAARDPELVVGLDFAFSAPAWFLEHHHLASAPELWELVEREGEGWLARCEWPFWGRPGKPRPSFAADQNPFRRAESDSISVGGVGPKSVFQIGGAGAVGTGSLRGMPHLKQLQRAGFSIWPFDPARLPLVVEIYPRYLTGRVTKSDVNARRLYFARLPGAGERELLRQAASCEDAFDAAVSALRMSVHAGEFSSLARETDATTRLEGSIWKPSDDPHFPSWMTRLASGRELASESAVLESRADPGGLE